MSITFEVIVCFRLFFFQFKVHKQLCCIVVRGASRMRTGQGIRILRQGILCHFRPLWGIFGTNDLFKYTFHFEGSVPPRCASGRNLINSVKILRLHIRFQIFVLKMLLLSQRGCNLQAAAMKFNTAMHMITVACILKSFLNRGLHGQFFMCLNLSWGFTNYTSYCFC